MPDAAFNVLVDVIAFHLGRFYLLVLTLGRFKPSIGDRSQPLVSLWGVLVTVVLIVGVAMSLIQS